MKSQIIKLGLSITFLFIFSTLKLSAQDCNSNITLKWSTFQGGNGAEEVVDLYVDPNTEKIYTIARTTSNSLIVTNGDLGLGGVDKAYIQCMNNDGTLIWSTMISDWKTPHNIFVDDTGNVILFGHTAHGNLPMSGGGFDKVFDGSSDMVYFKLDPNGTSIIGSSYIGGNGYEHIKGLNTNIDFHENKIYGVVSTSSSDMSTSSNALSSNVGDALIFSYDFNSESFSYTSYYNYSGLGSYSNFEDAPGTESLTVDDSGNIYLLLWNKSNDYTLTSSYITSNAIISDYPASGYNYPPIVVVLDELYNQNYGTYITNVIDNEGGPYSGGSSGYSVTGSFPQPNWSGFEIDVDYDGGIYILRQARSFRMPLYYDLSGILASPNFIGPDPYFVDSQGNTGFRIGSNIIKISPLSSINYEVDYVHHFSCGILSNPNAFKMSVDKYKRVNLVHNKRLGYYPIFIDNQSINYSQPFDESSSLISLTIFEEESADIVYQLKPGNDPFPNLNGVDPIPETRLYDMHFYEDEIYLFGKSALPSYPTTPSYRNFDQNAQVFTQQANFSGGITDGFITSLHSPIPTDNNTINDFDPLSNTFCANSYIHQNYGPVDGASISWLSGNGSQSDHIVPDIKKDNVISSHPIQYNSNFIQWQKSYDNVNWIDVPGAVQEDFTPMPESQQGNVLFRRLFDNCFETLPSNVITAIVSGNNDMTVDVGMTPYQHCTGNNTPLNISINGGSGDVSWQWFNGYAATSEIVPSMGSSTSGITAEVASTVDGGGVYRLVVTDNSTGCEVEALVTVRDPSVMLDQQYFLCPGQTSCVDIGPSFTDPDVSYQWVGPNGYTSSQANICVTDLGTYTLTLNNCTSTSVSTELVQNPHDPNLTSIPDYTFCQFDAATIIGMPTTAPAGYAFQWAPTQNISDITAFNPTYNPIIEFTNNPQQYTFSALRLLDGCIFEEDLDISVNKYVDVNELTSEYYCNGVDNLALSDFEGSFAKWEIIGTTFPGGLSGLLSDPLFSFDGSSQLIASSLTPQISYPQLSSNSYTISIEVEGSIIPLPNNCFDSKTFDITIYESCSYTTNCTSCPPPTCNYTTYSTVAPGTDGVCSGSNQYLTLGPTGTTNTYEWSIISIDNTPVSGSPLIGIFDQMGMLLTSPGPHPNSIIIDIDNPIPGFYDNISYELTSTSITGIICKDTLTAYSSDIYGPVVDLIDDFQTCSIGSSVLQSGTSIPLTVDGTFYNSAPNSNMNWSWQGPNIQNENTPFPTFNDSGTYTYTAKATDILSGCTNSDQIIINVSDASEGAGIDLTDICSGSIVQIPGPTDNALFSYVWNPPVGLNFPIGTPNNMVSSPYATVDQDITYTLTTTTPGCTSEDQMMITTSTSPPPNHPDQAYNSCIGDQIQVTLDASFLTNCTTCSYSWAHISGGNISFLSATTIPEPIITIPVSQVNTTVLFQLETTKGDCGSDIMEVTVEVSIPQSPQIPQSLNIDCGLPLSSISVANHILGNTYEWSSIDGLYEDVNMTIPLSSNNTALSEIYVYTNATQNYNVSTIQNGCYSAPSSITVINNTPLIADAGSDVDLCFGTANVTVGPDMSSYSGSTTFSWTASGINSNPYSNTFNTPTPTEEIDMLSWLNSTTVLNPIFQQGGFAVGAYEYTLTTQDGNCVNDDKMIIRVLENSFPSGFAGVSQNKCLDDCFYLLDVIDPDYNYTWTPFPASEISNMTHPYSNNPLVCPQGDVTYSVFLTENSTGCKSNIENVTYTLNPSPVIDDQLIEICQYDIEVDLTSYIAGYAALINPIWTINDGSGTIISNPTNYLIVDDIEFILSGENLFNCEDEGIITIENPSLVPNSDSFYKIIGDANENISKKIRFFDDHIYISYDHYMNNLPHASMIKYDRLGNIVWHTTMDYVSSIEDFVQDEDCQILAVGYKEEFSNTIDNESLILRFDSDNGTIISSTVIENNGREGLTKIIRRTVGSNDSYYIAGTRNGSSTPSSVDMTCLYHYKLGGTFLFDNYYTNDLSQLDEEGSRGLLELSDGNILLLGNDGPTGKGLIMKINGSTGNFIDGMFTNDIIDFYDAVETTSGDILVVGKIFNDDEGAIVALDASLNILSSAKFDNLTDFREIKHTTGSNYLIAGKAKNTEGFPVLFSIDYNAGIITTNNGYYINSFESDYNTFWFDYDELNNKVAYSDTRIGNPNGFGMEDVLVGIFDLNLTTICSQQYLPNLIADNVSKTTESFTKYPFGLTFSTAPNTIVPTIQEKSNICGCENNMVNFDGTNDQLQRTGMSLSGDFTISAWFNSSTASSGNAEDRIFSIGPTERLEIGIMDGGTADGELWIYENDNGFITTGDFVRDGLWHHVILTKNNGLTDIYLDGNLVGSYTVSPTNSYGTTMRFGNWIGGGTSSFFLGDIDEASIWNVGFSSSSIPQLNDCSIIGSEANLIAYYNMNVGLSGGDNSSITTIPDISGSGNDLSILNFNLNGLSSNIICSTTGIENECNACVASPVALCNSTYTATVSQGLDAVVNVTDIDDGSFSACGAVTLSFDPTNIVTELTYICPNDFGIYNEVLYVTDSNGQQSSCNVTITVKGSDELEALNEFYNSTNGDNWVNTLAGDRPWMTNCDPCGIEPGNDPWFGLTCWPSGNIRAIYLLGNNLQGTLPPSLNVFPELSWFNVSNNQIEGGIPDVCGLNLLYFVVNQNNLTGSIPSCLSMMTNLIDVNVHSNYLTGTIPPFGPNQPNLADLGFHNNFLEGDIPGTLGSIPNLNDLTLNNNEGSFQFMDLNGNTISGSSPGLSGCYPQQLIGLCQNPNLTLTDAEVNAGNPLLSSWSDFCTSGTSTCCPTTLTIDWEPVLDGTYRSSGDIILQTQIAPNANITLSHGASGMVNAVPPVVLNNAMLVISSNGCN